MNEMTPEEKGRKTWKANLEKDHPGLTSILKDQRLATAKKALEDAEHFETRGDFDAARHAYFAAYESCRQYDTLTNGGANAMVEHSHARYMDFAINRDPIFKKCMSEVNTLLERNPGMLQTELYPDLSVSKEDAGYCLRFADEAGIIRREKKGRTYQLWKS